MQQLRRQPVAGGGHAQPHGVKIGVGQGAISEPLIDPFAAGEPRANTGQEPIHGLHGAQLWCGLRHRYAEQRGRLADGGIGIVRAQRRVEGREFHLAHRHFERRHATTAQPIGQPPPAPVRVVDQVA